MDTTTSNCVTVVVKAPQDNTIERLIGVIARLEEGLAFHNGCRMSQRECAYWAAIGRMEVKSITGVDLSTDEQANELVGWIEPTAEQEEYAQACLARERLPRLRQFMRNAKRRLLPRRGRIFSLDAASLDDAQEESPCEST